MLVVLGTKQITCLPFVCAQPQCDSCIDDSVVPGNFFSRQSTLSSVSMGSGSGMNTSHARQRVTQCMSKGVMPGDPRNDKCVMPGDPRDDKWCSSSGRLASVHSLQTAHFNFLCDLWSQGSNSISYFIFIVPCSPTAAIHDRHLIEFDC